jgi:hypothetical protein
MADSGAPDVAPDAPGKGCLKLITCASGCINDGCRQACYDSGTDHAKMLYQDLYACAYASCLTVPDGGPGGDAGADAGGLRQQHRHLDGLHRLRHRHRRGSLLLLLVGLSEDRFYFYTPVLLIIGIATTVRGLRARRATAGTTASVMLRPVPARR